MAQKAIIHTATRVIRGLTTEETLSLPSDYSLVDLAVDIELSNGPWKLDLSNAKVQATVQEARDAGIDETYNAQVSNQLLLDFKDASILSRTRWIAVRDNTGLPADVRQAAQAQVGYIEALAKLLRSALT